jgi:predicted nicotinamide N-methyase
MWPSAVILATWLVTNPSLLFGDCSRSTTVLELGAGCGLTGLVAARLQQQQQRNQEQQSGPKRVTSTEEESTPSVLLTDFNPTVLENLKRNVELNEVTDVCRVVGLDFYQQIANSSTDHWTDMDGVAREPVDVVLGADIICQPADAVATAHTLNRVLRVGGSAYVVCADAAHRFGVDHFATECQRVGLQVSTHDTSEILNDDKVLCGQQHNLEQTAGYIDGMSLTMFTIRKALQ